MRDADARPVARPAELERSQCRLEVRWCVDTCVCVVDAGLTLVVSCGVDLTDSCMDSCKGMAHRQLGLWWLHGRAGGTDGGIIERTSDVGGICPVGFTAELMGSRRSVSSDAPG